MEPIPGRHALAAWIVLVAVCLGAIASAAWLLRDDLFGRGPSAIHDPSLARPTLTVCGRDYRLGGSVDTLSTIVARDGLQPVLVDPAPFAPCPAPNAEGSQPCSAVPGRCATVIYIRVGEDAYVGYSLRGGP